jgi:hypothetical protein
VLFLTGTAPTMVENYGQIRIENELLSDQSGPTQGLHNHAGAALGLLTPWSSFLTGILQNDADGVIAIGNVAKLMNQAVIDNDGEIINGNILFNGLLIRWRCNATLTGNAVQGAQPKDWCDHAPPDIEVPQSLTVEATGPDGAVASFLTLVKDDKDPSPRVMCAPMGSGDLFPLGSTTVTCTVTDYVGNSTSASFVVQVVDTLPASLSLRGEPIDVVVQDNQYVDEGATASDTVDGDVSAAIVVTGAVDTGTPGTYDLTYTVEDSSGNTSVVSRTVEVITPAAATSNLIEVVDALLIPARPREEMRRFLVRSEVLLADAIASNDDGACALLVQFDRSVGRGRASGVLAAGDASLLLDRSRAIQTGAC